MRRILSLLVFFFAFQALALNPITPDKVLSPQEIEEILRTDNFFLYRSLDETTPVWVNTHRKYGSHLLKDRTHFYTMDEVLHKVLTDTFPTQYKLEELYRAKMNIHNQLGSIIPSLNLGFGEGVSAIDVSKLFAGLFGFLQPANWIKLASQKKAYKVSKYMLTK